MSRVPQNARATPTIPPSRARTVLSVSTCTICRHLGAPSAVRTEVCCRRLADRTSIRFATFAHAISRTKAGDPHQQMQSRLVFVAHHLNTRAPGRQVQSLFRHERSLAGIKFGDRDSIATASTALATGLQWFSDQRPAPPARSGRASLRLGNRVTWGFGQSLSPLPMGSRTRERVRADRRRSLVA